MVERDNEVVQTYPLVGQDINTVGSYDILMLCLHYQTSDKSEQEGTEVDQTLWLTADVARQLISVLEAGIAKIRSGNLQVNEYRHH